jgi:hypothetical protein
MRRAGREGFSGWLRREFFSRAGGEIFRSARLGARHAGAISSDAFVEW